MAKGEDAVKLIKKVGREAAFKEIQGPFGDFKWDKVLIFVLEDETGIMLANRQYPTAVGTDMRNYKDADGRLLCQEIYRIAKTEGKGWTTCNQMIRKRDCYVLKVPDENMIVVSVYIK